MFLIQASIASDKACPLSDSKGNMTTRMKMEGLEDDTVTWLAIKHLQKNQQSLDPKQVKLGWFEKRKWAPIRIKNSGTEKEMTVLVNIRSAVKRLKAIGFEEKEIRNALKTNGLDELIKPVHSLKQLQEKQDPLLEEMDQDALAIQIKEGYQYVKKEGLIEQAKKQDRAVYRRHTDTALARSIQVTPDGKAFLHFNHYSNEAQQDIPLGAGAYKKVGQSIEIFEGKIYASAGIKDEDDKEFENLQLFKGKKGFVQLESQALYAPKKDSSSDVEQSENKPIMKERLVLEYYNGGNLARAICQGTLSEEDKQLIARDIINSMKTMHEMGYMHRDLKPGNIFLKRDDKGKVIEAVIGDLGSVIHVNKKDRKRAEVIQGTAFYSSPEYLVAIDEVIENGHKKRFRVAEETTQSNDIWSMGWILYQLTVNKSLPFGSEFDPHGKGAYNSLAGDMIVEASKFEEPKNKQSLEHLAWRMLKINPKERISAEEAAQIINAF